MRHQPGKSFKFFTGLTKKALPMLFLSLLPLFFTPACTTEGPIQALPSPTIIITEKPLPTSPPQTTHLQLSESGGPYLLIQSDFAEYQILDLSNKAVLPFDPPGTNGQYNLSANRSPSGQLMLFPQEDRNIILTDLVTGKIVGTHSLSNDDFEFDLEQVVQQAQTSSEGGEQTVAALSEKIDQAYQQFLIKIRWYQSDRYWLVTRVSSPTTTNLNVYDLKANSFTSLENQPGLMLDFWVGPDKDQILINKGYLNEPGTGPNSRYYVIRVSSGEIKEISLPEAVNNPRLFWLTSETIGIIHQMAPIGGIDFSILDLSSGQTKQIVKGTFTHISQYKEGLLSIKANQAEKRTTTAFTGYSGETIHQQAINNRCYYKGRMDDLILLNCETDSYILDENLRITPFGPLVSLLVPAGQGENAILVIRNGETFLLNRNTLKREPLVLEGTPIEIRWLPDGSGFLYRLSGELFVYDLKIQASNLLLESTILSDYTNINAVWIDPD